METKPKQGSTLEALREAALKLARAETETDPVPEAIERMCAARVGKPITKRDAAALEEQFPGLDVRITRDDFGTKISYWVSGSMGNKYNNDEGVFYPSQFTGEFRDVPIFEEDGLPRLRYDGTQMTDRQSVSNPSIGEARRRLFEMGVGTYGNTRDVQVRQSRWRDPQGGAGATRWPTVAELREWNAWCYGARETRNEQRVRDVEALQTPGALPLEKIAALVDEINLLARELSALVDDDATPGELHRVVRASLLVKMKTSEELRNDGLAPEAKEAEEITDDE